MTEWNTNWKMLTSEPELSPFPSPPLPQVSDIKIAEVFPDVRNLLVARRLKEWGIDAGQVPIRSGGEEVAFMGTLPQGIIYVHLPSVAHSYPEAEYQYLVLAHELAHLLQFVEDRVDWKGNKRWRTLHEWASLEHELDAIRWEAREAKRMGISRQEFEKMLHRGLPTISRKLALETRPVYAGTYPEERGVRPMFRHPVHVRRHVRRLR